MQISEVDWAPFQTEFPHLFRRAELRDMAVGEGWFELLWALSTSLEVVAAQGAASGLRPFRIVQVKEKFGGLRFYTAGDITTEARTLIQEACTRSESVCEACGEPGNRCMIDNWIETLCPFHQLVFGGIPLHG